MFTRETLKQALISIAVGASIAFITALLNGLLDYVNNLHIDVAGSVTGMGYYLMKWNSARLG